MMVGDACVMGRVTDVDTHIWDDSGGGGVRVTDVDTHIWDDSGEGVRVTDVDTHIWEIWQEIVGDKK